MLSTSDTAVLDMIGFDGRLHATSKADITYAE
jgi:hypothetical protein